MLWFGTSQRAGVTYDQAKPLLIVRLPETASKIAFWQHFHQICNVDFDVDEASFLAWCRARDWDPVPVDETCGLIPPLRDGASTAELFSITGGYKAVTVPKSGDRNGIVYYDKPSQRAFYRFHSY